MSELNSILKRAELGSIISYLMDGEGTSDEIVDDIEQKLKNSYDIIFNRIEKLYPQANRNDDNLYDAVMDFAKEHDDSYFQVGVLAGFRLYRGIEQSNRDE